MATFTRTTARVAESGIKRLFVAHPLSAYFVLAFGLMWLFVVPLGLSRSHGSGVLPYDLSEGWATRCTCWEPLSARRLQR